jgi:hypothetical protein
MTFQLVSDNSTWLRDATVTLKTTELPKSLAEHYVHFFPYETCLFVHGKSEVVDTYMTLAEAVEGHRHYEKIYKVSE